MKRVKIQKPIELACTDEEELNLDLQFIKVKRNNIEERMIAKINTT